MVVSRFVQKKVEMFIKHDYEQNYSYFEEDENKGPLSVETEQPCIATDKLPCVKQEQASNLTGGSRDSSHLGKVMAKYGPSMQKCQQN